MWLGLSSWRGMVTFLTAIKSVLSQRLSTDANKTFSKREKYHTTKQQVFNLIFETNNVHFTTNVSACSFSSLISILFDMLIQLGNTEIISLTYLLNYLLQLQKNLLEDVGIEKTEGYNWPLDTSPSATTLNNCQLRMIKYVRNTVDQPSFQHVPLTHYCFVLVIHSVSVSLVIMRWSDCISSALLTVTDWLARGRLSTQQTAMMIDVNETDPICHGRDVSWLDWMTSRVSSRKDPDTTHHHINGYISARGCDISAREVKYQCPGRVISAPGGEISEPGACDISARCM